MLKLRDQMLGKVIHNSKSLGVALPSNISTPSEEAQSLVSCELSVVSDNVKLELCAAFTQCAATDVNSSTQWRLAVKHKRPPDHWLTTSNDVHSFALYPDTQLALGEDGNLPMVQSGTLSRVQRGNFAYLAYSRWNGCILKYGL